MRNKKLFFAVIAFCIVAGFRMGQLAKSYSENPDEKEFRETFGLVAFPPKSELLPERKIAEAKVLQKIDDMQQEIYVKEDRHESGVSYEKLRKACQIAQKVGVIPTLDKEFPKPCEPFRLPQ